MTSHLAYADSKRAVERFGPVRGVIVGKISRGSIDMKTRNSSTIAGIASTLLALGMAEVAMAGTDYDDLLQLFADWRAFEAPPTSADHTTSGLSACILAMIGSKLSCVC